MIVIQALAIAVALVVMVAMALGPQILDWHERTPVHDDQPEARRRSVGYQPYTG